MPILSAALLLAATAAVCGAPAPAGAGATRWSDPAAWPGGRVPAAGADVTIPAGRAVLLDVTPPALGTLTVAGELAFADADLALAAHAIRVSGRLAVGSEERPFRCRATITLTGAPDDRDADAAKGLWVLRGGALELHGEPRAGWTRLAATAERGATALALERRMVWRAGDTVVVAPSGYYQSETEVRAVRAVSARGGLTVLALDRPLEHRHWGETSTVAGRTVDQRAEVGLLSRNVVVRGDAASEASGYGGHVLVDAGGTAHVDGVELYRMGQAGRQARYPMHWHMAGHVPGQYLARSSVWRSFNRCVTVHGSHEALVADNVCYDHTGHGYFIEDGVETANVLRGNLGVFSRRGTTIPTDRVPATFWVTNPDNALVGNAAAGTVGHGYWYALPKYPTGLSATKAVAPFMVPLRRFDRNVAHSAGGAGMVVEGDRSLAAGDGSYEVDYRPRDPKSGAPVTASFTNFTSYMNAEQGFWSRGDHHAVVGLVSAGNRIGAQIGDATIGSASVIRDALIVGETALRSPVPNSAPHYGTHVYDGPVRLENVTFANYPASGGTPGAAIGPEWGFDGRVAPDNGGRGLRFVNALPFLYPAAVKQDGERQAVFRDADGSAAGVTGGVVVPDNPLLRDATCVARPAWHAAVCRTPVAAVWLQTGPAGPQAAPARVTRDDGVTARYAGYQPHTLALTLLAGRRYAVAFESGATPRELSLTWFALDAGRALDLELPYPYAGFTLDAGRRAPVPVAASCAAARDSRRTTVALDRGRKVLCVRIVGVGGKPEEQVTVRGS